MGLSKRQPTSRPLTAPAPKSQERAIPPSRPFAGTQQLAAPPQSDAATTAQDGLALIDAEGQYTHSFGQMRVHTDAPRRLQPKLAIGRPGDAYEQEAERVAAQVLRSPARLAPIRPATASRLQRCAACAAQLATPSSAPRHGHLCAACAAQQEQDAAETSEERLQAAVVPGSALELTPAVERGIAALRGGGQPLDADTRAFMEPRFGHDFGQVRVHADARAAQTAGAVHALAFTLGCDIVFGAGQYAPNTDVGKRLLAHELTHVVQQNSELIPRLHKGRPIDKLTDRMVIQRQESLDGGVGLPNDASLPGGVGDEQEISPPVWAPPADIRTVKIWINAFIPRDVPGTTQPAPGRQRGKTMLRGPFRFSDCFLTDQRSFRADVHASSRIHSEVEIDLSTPRIAWQWHHCSKTHEIDCEDGDVECARHGTVHGGYSSVQITSSSSFIIGISAKANNPCFTGSPNIEFQGVINVDLTTQTVSFYGYVDQFPAFEMYATADGGAGREIFQSMPPPGNDPGDLVHTGGPNLPISGETQI